MGKFYPELNEPLREFISKQKMFFTASAPESGRVNLSPKGMDTFRCIDNKTVAYLDLTGSSNETAAHLLENGRLTIMTCSFSDDPMVLRLYGIGRVIHPRDQEWDKLYSHFTPTLGERQIIVLNIDSVKTSCGFAVPIYELKKRRNKLTNWAKNKGEKGLSKYWKDNNQISIDGLPTNLLND